MMTEIRITFVIVSVVDSFWLVFDLELSVWSNFEIADMDFWRSEAYMKYFDYLDSKGGFYYEVCISSAIRLWLISSLAMGRCTSAFISGGAFRSERPDTHV